MKTILFAAALAALSFGTARAGESPAELQRKEAHCIAVGKFAREFATERDEGKSKIQVIENLRDFNAHGGKLTEGEIDILKSVLDVVFQERQKSPAVLGDEVYDICTKAIKS